MSSAKLIPEPPRLVINALRDIFTRWTNEGHTKVPGKTDVLPLVYRDDVLGHVLNALATIAAGAMKASSMLS